MTMHFYDNHIAGVEPMTLHTIGIMTISVPSKQQHDDEHQCREHQEARTMPVQSIVKHCFKIPAD